jgi:MGT family glycosyltransferase
MSNILMTVWPIETHLTPFVAVARALRARGHAVAFYTGEQVRGQLERGGFRCFVFQDVDHRHSDCNPGTAAAQKLGMRARRRMWRDFLLGSVAGQLRDLERIWTAWQPDAIVCDITMWGTILVIHETKSVPVAVFSHPAYCLLPGRENPAPGISLPRPRTRAARFVARLLSRGINLATASIPREASRIRREYGLAPLDGTVIDLTGKMPLHLVPSAPEFDYGRDDLPSSVRYVGPCICEEEEQQPAPEWVTSIRGQRPRIVVLEETHCAEDAFLLKTAAAAFAGHSAEVVLVAGQGREPAGLNLGKLAANVRLAPWTPLKHALATAEVVVAHGNSETVLASLGRGIPMVIVPRMLEQPQLAWRLSASGAGIRLPVRRCTPERLRQAVERILGAPVFGYSARRVGTALARMGGPSRAAELIEHLDRPSRLTQTRTA